MIGDSVSNGYHAYAVQALNATYEVVHAPGNNGNTNWGKHCLGESTLTPSGNERGLANAHGRTSCVLQMAG